MAVQLGDDGELILADTVEKTKRKRKSFPGRMLQSCIQFVFFAAFFISGGVGGAALYFVRRPTINAAQSGSNISMGCLSQIKMISVGSDSMIFPDPNVYYGPGRTLISLDGHSTQEISRPGDVYSLSLARDDVQVVEARRLNVSPNYFIYTWAISNDLSWNENLLTDGLFPSWSPDMKQIAFFKISGGLYIMNADGSNSRLLHTTYPVSAPASWSPDGTQLVFSVSDNNNSITQNVYIINIGDKSEKAIVDNGVSAGFPAWSPDGKTIAYVSHDIYTINVDGSNRHNVTNNKVWAVSSVGWSPDSQNLVFLGQDLATPHPQAIYVIDSSGTGLHNIYHLC